MTYNFTGFVINITLINRRKQVNTMLKSDHLRENQPSLYAQNYFQGYSDRLKILVLFVTANYCPPTIIALALSAGTFQSIHKSQLTVFSIILVMGYRHMRRNISKKQIAPAENTRKTNYKKSKRKNQERIEVTCISFFHNFGWQDHSRRTNTLLPPLPLPLSTQTPLLLSTTHHTLSRPTLLPNTSTQPRKPHHSPQLQHILLPQQLLI